MEGFADGYGVFWLWPGRVLAGVRGGEPAGVAGGWCRARA